MTRVVRAEGFALRRAFFALPGVIYRGDVRRREPFIRAHGALFLALEDGCPVARTMVGPVSGAVGSFALFDCLPRPGAVRALMTEVAAFQRTRGCTELVGPVASGPADVTGGVLVEGFGGIPAALDAYNASWYGECLEAAGFIKRRDMLAYRFTSDEAIARCIALGDRAAARYQLIVEHADIKHPRAIAEALASVWSDGAELTISPDRASDALEPLMEMLDARFVLFAREKGKKESAPVGALLGMMDSFGGLRIASMRVAPAWRARGAAAVLAGEMARSIRESGIRRLEASLIDETNWASRLCVERAGGMHCRVYREYTMRL